MQAPKTIKFLKKINFIWSIPLSVALFIGTQKLLWWYDDTSAPMDIGILHRITSAVVHMLCYVATVMFIIGLNFPSYFRYYYNLLSEDFEKLTPWERQKLFFCLFGFLLYLLVQLTPTGSARAYRPHSEQSLESQR